jgi:type I restriction enzyme S subunit
VGTTVKRIDVREIEKIPIPVPPLPEQIRIADILDDSINQIQITSKLIQTYNSLKKGMIHQLLTCGIGHTRFKKTKIGEIPESWEITKLGQICDIRGRVGWRGYKREDLRSSGPIVLGASNIDEQNRLDLSGTTHLSKEKFLESPEIMVSKNDLLIVQRGSLGKIAIVDSDLGECTINPSMILLTNVKINPYYLYYSLCSNRIQHHISQTSSRTGVPMISQAQVKDMNIQIPSRDEQGRIAISIRNLDDIIQSSEISKIYSNNLKIGLMQILFAGKVRVATN